MKTNSFMRIFILISIALLALPVSIQAADPDQQAQDSRFSKEELDQMLAPIALYPDSLIASILMASTYPLEVVEAERWVRQNTALKGDELDEALKKMPWDPAVKSLCHFPDILYAMSEKLEQTGRLGDAFLRQESDVMATIQELRRKAQERGNLASTKEQNILVERDVIRIEPADPRVIYVPAYDPLYVYGPWWYPSYPPYYWYYPPGFVTGGYIGFGPGFFVGFGLSSWAWFDWHNHHIHTDHHKARHFHGSAPPARGGVTYWRHDPKHRGGVPYRDRVTSERYSSRPSAAAPPSGERRVPPTKSIERKAAPPPQAPKDLRVSPSGSGKSPERRAIEGAPAPVRPAPAAPAPPRGPSAKPESRPPEQKGGEQKHPGSPAGDMRGPNIETGRPGGPAPEGGGFQGGGGRPQEPAWGGGPKK